LTFASATSHLEGLSGLFRLERREGEQWLMNRKVAKQGNL